MTNRDIEVSCVMPCLNEEETVGACIKKALDTMRRLGISGEVVVADNGSTDRSVEIARSLGARVVIQPEKGYGSAYLKGISEAYGKYVIIADSDGSHDLSDLERFILPLRQGYDMVMGTRLRGKIMPGAMSWLHRYVGNPLLSGILRVLYRTSVSDAHCGMRSFAKDVYEKLQLQTTGMEFASEMVVKASMLDLKIAEVPITTYPAGRTRGPHLRTFRDGWRHLRFMLMYAPTWLYLIPGLSLFCAGLIILLSLLPGPLRIGRRVFDINYMVLGSMLTILGYQVVVMGVQAKIFIVTHKLASVSSGVKKAFHYFNLERGLAAGAGLLSAGFGALVYVLVRVAFQNYSALQQFRIALLGMTLVVLGVQTLFSSFFLSMMGSSAGGRR